MFAHFGSNDRRQTNLGQHHLRYIEKSIVYVYLLITSTSEHQHSGIYDIFEELLHLNENKLLKLEHAPAAGACSSSCLT